MNRQYYCNRIALVSAIQRTNLTESKAVDLLPLNEARRQIDYSKIMRNMCGNEIIRASSVQIQIEFSSKSSSNRYIVHHIELKIYTNRNSNEFCV